MSRRLHYIDWLRVLAVLLLFPFHTWRVYNLGEDNYVKGPELSLALSYAIGFIDRWHMPLLFLLAGASTYFALRRRTGREYASERVLRLLVPFIFGVFVLIPPQTWIGAMFNSGYTGSFVDYIASGAFLQFNIRDGGDYYGGFGIGHLWFIVFLFVISLVVLPLLLWAGDGRGLQVFSRAGRVLAHPAGALAAALFILIGDALPDLFGINPFYYAAFFVLGYVIMCEDSFMDSAVRYRWFALTGGIALTLFWVFSWQLRDSFPDPSLPLAALAYLGTLAAWLMIVGILGFGRTYLDWRSPALDYLAEGSYPVYLLHQTVIVVLGWLVVQIAVTSWLLQSTLLLATSVIVTFLIYGVVRRTRATRFLFGMRALRKD